MALMELGFGPALIDVHTVANVRDEQHIDLAVGDRGFMLQVRSPTTAVLRVSNIKGEVSKTTGGKYWTVPAEKEFSLLGLRTMNEDALDEDGNPLDFDAVEDGEILEQRWYWTSETANTVVESVIIPGT